MSTSKPVYIVSYSKGNVVTLRENNNPSAVVLGAAGAKGDEQKWILEFGEEPNMVASKCVANNKYLRILDGFAPSVHMGERMRWKMDQTEYMSLAPLI
jgi:hypothetical protein